MKIFGYVIALSLVVGLLQAADTTDARLNRKIDFKDACKSGKEAQVRDAFNTRITEEEGQEMTDSTVVDVKALMQQGKFEEAAKVFRALALGTPKRVWGLSENTED